MGESLFRKDFLDSARKRGLGRVSLAQPAPAFVLGLLPITLALTVVLFACFGSYTERTRVAGRLVPTLGLSDIVASRPGVVAQLRVIEGQRVEKGDVIGVVASREYTLEDGDTSHAIKQNIELRRISIRESYRSRMQQLDDQLASQRRRLLGVERELAMMADSVRNLHEQASLAKEILDRFELLGRTQYVSELQVQQQRSIYLQRVGDVQALERQVASLKESRSELIKGIEEHGSQVEQLESAEEQDLLALARESIGNTERAENVLRAPVSGEVGVVVATVGQSVRGGDVVASVVPHLSELEAHLLVPSRAIGFVNAGDPVWIRYVAFPHQQFGQWKGVVSQISTSPMGHGSDRAEPVYRVVVELDQQAVTVQGQVRRLRPGMMLEADIEVGRKRIWEWVMQPLLNLKRSEAEA